MYEGAVKQDILFSGGLDESSPATQVALSDAIEMSNFRLSRDGKRTCKRLGLEQDVLGGAGGTFGASKTVYGYSTYYDSDAAFCQLAVTSDQIWRKVAAGSWTSIHTFSSAISHPVKIISIQGKQFIINETDSRMVHTDKTDYGVGITAPTTIPTLTGSYVETPSTDDDMDYANQGAMDAVWTDGDSGGAASTLDTSDPDSVAGPDADAKYLRMTDASPGAGHYARRSLTLADIQSLYTVEIDSYFDVMGYLNTGAYLEILIYNGATKFQIAFQEGKVALYNGSAWIDVNQGNNLNKWQNWRMAVDTTDPANSTLTFYKDDVSQGEFAWDNQDATNIGLIQITAYSAAAIDLHIDHFTIQGAGEESASSNLNGSYRYAVTYVRSGNYGCESNPTYSNVGAATLVGAGLDDLTAGGTYEGTVDKTIHVYIDAAGTPDTFKWSNDGGVTWLSTGIPLTTDTIYLSEGVTLTFAANTGHTATNYWTIACDACQISAVNQKVSLSSIPVSGDAQVDQRKIYRTTSNGARFYWLATISDNTTTTFVDNIPDHLLGSQLQEDKDTLINGKYSAWWDNRLWIADATNKKVYYSEVNYPEQLDADVRFVDIPEEGFDNTMTGFIAYKDAIYVFLQSSIYVIIRKPGGIYGRYLVTKDVGCIAPWSMCEVNNTLTFLSYRGWEMYNGFESRPQPISLPLQRIFDSIDTSSTYLDAVTSVHNRKYNEIWLSLPHRTGGAAAITVVYNYKSNKLYTFTFHKTPSCLVECRDSSKIPVVKMGTTDGYIFEADSTYQDGSTNITATIRKPWINTGFYSDIRHLRTEFEIPSAKILTVNIYTDFDKDVQLTAALTGVTLDSTDIELRRPIRKRTPLGQQGDYFCIEYVNAENLAGDLYLNQASFYYKPRTEADDTYGD